MMPEDRASPATTACPACKSPVSPGDRFCEICGAKIPPPQTQAPVCRSCGTPLQPGARFCENCGDPVKTTVPPVAGPASGPVVPAPSIILEQSGPRPEPISQDRLPAEPDAAAAIDPGLWEDKGPDRVEEETGSEAAEEEPEPEPEVEEQEPETESGPVDELLLGLEPEEPPIFHPKKTPQKTTAATPVKPAKQAKPAAPAPAAVKKRGGMPLKKVLMVAGLAIAVIAIAIAAFAMMPLLKGYGTSPPPVTAHPATPAITATPVPTVSPLPTSTPAAVVNVTPGKAAAVTVATAIPPAGNVPGAEEALPPQYTLYFNVDKNSVTGDVTVTATGPSRNVVKDIDVKVTHPDGSTDSDHLIPSQGMTDVTITGTQNPERVQVTVLFYSGDQYKVIDRIVSYAMRG